MPTKESIERRLNQIREEEDKGTAIELLADLICEVEASKYSDVQQLREQLKMVREILVGNGNPLTSVIARLEALEKQGSNVGKDVKVIRSKLLGDLEDSNPAESILNRVDENCKAVNGLKNLGWILVSAIILEALARIFNLF